MLFNASVTARLRRFPCRSILRQLQVSQPQNATYHILARLFRKITSPKQSSKNEGGHVGEGSPSCWSGHDRQYWLDDLLPACTLFPVVPDRCGARGEAETQLQNGRASGGEREGQCVYVVEVAAALEN